MSAFRAIVTKAQFDRVGDVLRWKAPKIVHPRCVTSTYLLSGLVKCGVCRRSLTGQGAKSGRYAHNVCQSKMKRGNATCKTPRLSARRFEKLVVGRIRGSILTERNIRDLARLVNEEMDGAAREQREKAASIRREIDDARRRLGRLYAAIEDSDLEVSDLAPRIRELRDREQKLLDAEREAERALSDRKVALGEDLGDFLKNGELTERRAFISSFVEAIVVDHRPATIPYTLPLPEDAPSSGLYIENVSIPRPVLSTANCGGTTENKTGARFVRLRVYPRHRPNVITRRRNRRLAALARSNRTSSSRRIRRRISSILSNRSQGYSAGGNVISCASINSISISSNRCSASSLSGSSSAAANSAQA